MGKIIIRFWESKTIGGQKMPHISLQTTNWYFSVYPALKAAPSAMTETKLPSESSRDLNQILPVKLAELVELKESEPTHELTLPDLDEEAIERAIEIFSQEKNFTWKMWGTKNTESFNCATAVLLLLRIGGISAILKEFEIAKKLGKETEAYKALFNLEVPSDFGAFVHFSRMCNNQISPSMVLDIARASTQKSYRSYLPNNLYEGISALISFTITTLATYKLGGALKEDRSVFFMGGGLCISFCLMGAALLISKSKRKNEANSRGIVSWALVGAAGGVATGCSILFFRSGLMAGSRPIMERDQRLPEKEPDQCLPEEEPDQPLPEKEPDQCLPEEEPDYYERATGFGWG